MDVKPGNRRTFGLIPLIVAVIAVAILAAFGWKQGYFKSKERVALVTWNQDPFWNLVSKGAQDAADEYGLNLSFVMSPPDQAAQTKIIKDFIAKGVAGMAVSPNNPQAQADVLNEAAAKTVLLTFDSDAPNTNRRGLVGTDDYGAGQMAGDQVRAAIPDGGAVLISVGSIDMLNGRDRRQGVIDGLLDRPFNRSQPIDAVGAPLAGKTYTIAGTVLDGGDPAKATQQVADALKTHPDVKCVVGLFSYSAPAIVDAIDKAGLAGKVKVIGFDEADATQAGVESGKIFSSVLQDQYLCGYETVRLLAEIIRGTYSKGIAPSPRMTQLPINTMTANNITELRKQEKIRIPATNPSESH